MDGPPGADFDSEVIVILGMFFGPCMLWGPYPEADNNHALPLPALPRGGAQIHVIYSGGSPYELAGYYYRSQPGQPPLCPVPHKNPHRD